MLAATATGATTVALIGAFQQIWVVLGLIAVWGYAGSCLLGAAISTRAGAPCSIPLMSKRVSSPVVEAAIVLVALALAFGAAVVGFAVGRASGDNASDAPLTATTGHVGEGLTPQVFGDPVNGERLFASKGCADCHSYAGKGGSDAPPLDFMSGHLSPREVANMSGEIWNHMPAMLPHFEDEGMPFPTFAGYEMSDLIAYLHSAQPPHAGGTTSGGGSGTMTGMSTAP